MSQFSITVDAKDDKQFKKLLHATIGTKFINRWFEQFSSIAIDAVRTIAATDKAGRTSVDIKRFLRVEKVKQLLQIFILFFFSRRKDHIFCIYIFSFLQLINNFNTPKKKNLAPDPRRRYLGVSYHQRCNLEQRCHTCQNAPPHREPAHYLARLPP